jgi:hypothetical protein
LVEEAADGRPRSDMTLKTDAPKQGQPEDFQEILFSHAKTATEHVTPVPVSTAKSSLLLSHQSFYI